MRIGVDITPLQNRTPGGIGTSLYETLRALQRRGADLTLFGTQTPVVPFSEQPLDIDAPLILGSGALASSNIAWLQYGLASLTKRSSVDVFWGTRHVLPRNTPSLALVATAYDFWYATHPDQQPLVNRTLNRYVTHAFMSDADVITAISDATASDARRLFSDASDRVRTVLLGVDRDRFKSGDRQSLEDVRTRFGINSGFILVLDAYNPRKNASSALKAVSELQRHWAPEVVVLGRPRKTASEYDPGGEARHLGLSEHQLHLLGDVGPDELVALYSQAAVVVYPSLYEGFGMPVLEAMAAGVPVICSNTSSLPQVAGDAALLVDPLSSKAIAAAIERVLSDHGFAADLARRGRIRAKELTWDATADGMLRAFSDAIETHSERH